MTRLDVEKDRDNDCALLVGVPAIAGFLDVPRRRAQYLCETGAIPVFKERGRWTGRRSTLCDHYRRLEEMAAPATDIE
jgi:hypothetical protein